MTSTQVRAKSGELRKTFRVIDKDKDGVCSYDEFRKGMELLNVGLSEKEVDGLLREFDPNRDGAVEYHEFCEALQADTKPRRPGHGETADWLRPKVRGLPNFVKNAMFRMMSRELSSR